MYRFSCKNGHKVHNRCMGDVKPRFAKKYTLVALIVASSIIFMLS